MAADAQSFSRKGLFQGSIYLFLLDRSWLRSMDSIIAILDLIGLLRDRRQFGCLEEVSLRTLLLLEKDLFEGEFFNRHDRFHSRVLLARGFIVYL